MASPPPESIPKQLTARTPTQELVFQAVSKARAKGDTQHENFLKKFWNLNEHDEVVARSFPCLEDGSGSDGGDIEHQTGCEHVNCDTKLTSIRCGARSSPVEGGELERSSNQQTKN